MSPPSRLAARLRSDDGMNCAFRHPRLPSLAVSALHRRWLASSRPLLNTPSAHHDLDSFLQYARTSGLNLDSTVFAGTTFEYTVMNTLCGLGMSLTRTGGRSDAGIDLTGTWVAPTASNAAHPLPPVSVYVSCKALQGTRKTGPSLLRELVGTINATPQGVDAFGILAAATPCTEETRKRLAMSTAALGFVCITPQEVEMVKRGRGRPANGAEQEWVLKEGGVLRQFIWNDAAAEMLGRGLGCTARYVLPKPGEVAQNGGVIEEVVLTLDGIPIKPEKKRSTRSKKTKM